jgi:hypothetical protein
MHPDSQEGKQVCDSPIAALTSLISGCLSENIRPEQGPRAMSILQNGCVRYKSVQLINQPINQTGTQTANHKLTSTITTVLDATTARIFSRFFTLNNKCTTPASKL